MLELLKMHCGLCRIEIVNNEFPEDMGAQRITKDDLGCNDCATGKLISEIEEGK
jgi:hypothetical protein